MSATQFMLTVEPLPQGDDPDGTRRLRSALKRLLRSYGLRCVAVTTASPTDRVEAMMNQEPLAAIPGKKPRRRAKVTSAVT